RRLPDQTGAPLTKHHRGRDDLPNHGDHREARRTTVRQKPARHWWRGLDRLRRLPHFLWALTCVSWVLVAVWGETGTTPQRDFATWLQELRAEATALGIRPQTLDIALAGLQPLARVIELDRKQPEETLTYAQYLARVLPASRVQKGRRLLHEHSALLQEIGAKYGVPPGLIVALWGLETDFGRMMGNSPVLASLATLPY